jgi:uncharacterized protein YlbG (UPF0298 family)
MNIFRNLSHFGWKGGIIIYLWSFANSNVQKEMNSIAYMSIKSKLEQIYINSK